VQTTSDLVRSAIAYVKENFPYWNASNGADHFMVFSYDHGKCEMAKALRFEEFGDMFSIQAYGSLVYRCSALPRYALPCSALLFVLLLDISRTAAGLLSALYFLHSPPAC
jgi:hypothetical protein